MDAPSKRNMIQVEEVKTNAAVSESVMNRIAQSINFINTNHVLQHDFNLNGEYNTEAVPNNSWDGYFTYPFPFQIVDIQIKSGEQNGSGGQNEFDLKWAAEGSNTFVSIFSTTPKFNSTVNNDDTIRIGQTKSGWVAPVLSKTTFAAWDKIRLDLLTQLEGDVNSAHVKILFRPISP